MNTLLDIMDKLYGDTKMLTIIYVVGAILLLIFIILLIVSLRNPDSKKEEDIIEEPKINDEPNEKKEEAVEEPREEEKNESEIKPEEEIPEETKVPTEESTYVVIENDVDEKETEEVKDVSTDAPSVDDFVDDIVKKTYEKNEQFSSVYVGDNTSTVKLDKVLEDLNVDEDVKDAIVPPEETREKNIEVNNDSISEALSKEDASASVPVVNEVPDIEIPSITEEEVNKELPEEKNDEKSEEIPNSLDSLKAAMDSKKAEIESKQDELKAKLAGLKNNTK